MTANFRETVERIDPGLLKLEKLQTLQVNLGNRCNQRCVHCHVQASPEGKKIMSREVMGKVMDFLSRHPWLKVDVTGGCPELNPDFRFFVEGVYHLASALMIRTNLTVFFEQGLERLANWYSDHRVVLIASLPCYLEDNVDRQRGQGVFKKSIEALQLLNDIGYGVEDGLEIDLVYNPVDKSLPGPQQQLEENYKRQLGDRYGIYFNKLFTITNAPIGRFRQYLESNGQLGQYMQLLADQFNPLTAANVMCRNLVSVDYRGVLYNCDFNQALGLCITDCDGRCVKIDQLDEILAGDIEIKTSDHCFCCTAGTGSSCSGSLVK